MSHTPAFVPFITGKEVCGLISELYADAPFARVGLYQLARLGDCLPSNRLWIDPGADGLDDLSRGTPAKDKDNDPRRAWYDLITSVAGHQQIADPAFQKAPNRLIVDKFVDAALGACLTHRPAAISIPQLPHVNDGARNKVNKALAEGAAKWQLKHPRITLILPVILNHSTQSENKTARNAHVKSAAQCLAASKAKAVWIVDASFNDEELSAEIRRKRMHGLISFHQEFNALTHSVKCARIGGPYWALNLVLWSRGLIDQFGIGVGTGYRYYLSGGFPSSGTAKIAIEPLYRRAKVGSELRDWFAATLKSIESTHPFHSPLTRLRPLATAVSTDARRQTAIFYRTWIDALALAPAPGRAMALFQSLSIAFSYGKQLADDLDAEGSTRRPESIAEPLMLNCL
jgi:hypothetical protein